VPEVLAFLAALRDVHPDMARYGLNGGCFRVYLLLKQAFPGAEAWYDSDHVLTRIGDHFYDIRGQVEPVSAVGAEYLRMDRLEFNRAYGWDQPALSTYTMDFGGQVGAVSDAVLGSCIGDLLPGAYYMDPPDGGDVPVAEQLSRMAKDAERYRWLRSQHWNEAEMAVVSCPKSSVKLGVDCPSLERLDAAIDAALSGGGMDNG
jgi:hypothetical protein